MKKLLCSLFALSAVSTAMAQEINRYGSPDNNYLLGKLAVELIETKGGKKYTTLDIFSKAVEYNFGELKGYELVKVKNFLIQGFMVIIGQYTEEFKMKDLFVNAEPQTFIGYIALLSKVYKLDNWDIELAELLGKFDFRKTNSEWNKIGLFNTTVTKRNTKKVSEFFMSITTSIEAEGNR